MEKRWSFQQATVMCFVDFASAFDSVDRNSLWRIMAADGMPPKLLRLIKAHYSSTKMKVRAGGSDSMPFETRSGVRQGCALSPTRTKGRDYQAVVRSILLYGCETWPVRDKMSVKCVVA